MVVSRPTTALTSGGLSVRGAANSRCVRLSQACWRREELAECTERPPSVATLPSDLLTLGGRVTWYVVGVTVTSGSVFAGMAGRSRS